MGAEFHVVESCVMRERDLVLLGKITSGKVRAGMHAQITFNSSFSLAVPIRNVEAVRGTTRMINTGLVLDTKDEAELTLLNDLNIRDEIVEITDGPQA